MHRNCLSVLLILLTCALIVGIGLQTTLAFGQQEAKSDFKLQDLLMILIIYLLISIGLIVLCLLMYIYFPLLFPRIVEYSKNSAGKSLLLGLGNCASIFALLVLLGQFEGNPIQILMIPLLLVGGIGILTGFFAESQLVGQKIIQHGLGNELSPAKSIIVGIGVIAFGALVPIIGQLALLLIVLKGFGAFIGTVFNRKLKSGT